MGIAQLEALEARRLFVAGTEGDDVIEVQTVGGDALHYRVLVNGTVAADVVIPPQTLPENRVFTVEGLGGDDVITIDPLLDAPVFAVGDEGNDTIVGGNHDDRLMGRGGDDLIFGKAGRDWIAGGGGNDTVRGGLNSDTLHGDRDDLFDHTTGGGDDLVFGEGGFDILRGGGGNDLLNGGADTDILDGGDGGDLILGADGDDRTNLRGRAAGQPFLGSDTLDGGSGSDTLDVDSIDAPLYLTLDGVANDGLRGDLVNVMPTFEVITGRLFDGSVIDLSHSPVGVEAGFITTEFTHKANFAVAIIGSPFDDTLQAGGFTPAQVDGRGGDDAIRGSDNTNDLIFGGDGNDSLRGGGGKDSIVGEDGDDFIEGGFGNDRIAGGVGSDIAYGDDADPAGTVIYGSDTIEGNAGNDVLIGGGNNDRIFGHGGRDTLIGGGGNDTMFGGPEEADKILGGAGTDSAAQDDKDTYDSVEVLLT